MANILAFSGSNSGESINSKLINASVRLLNTCSYEVIDLRDYPAPMFGVDLERNEGIPDSMYALNEKMKGFDGFLISSPEHNGSMPAFFKNTIDWLSRIEPKIFDDKPTVFLSTSPGARGGASALGILVATMPHRGAQVIGSYSLGSFQDHFHDGILSDVAVAEILPLLKDLEKNVLANS